MKDYLNPRNTYTCLQCMKGKGGSLLFGESEGERGERAAKIGGGQRETSIQEVGFKRQVSAGTEGKSRREYQPTSMHIPGIEKRRKGGLGVGGRRCRMMGWWVACRRLE